MKTKNLCRWGIVIALLWLHAWLRFSHILTQDPYLDEGFHLSRATFIWTYDDNPGYYAGKLLAYYYYGLFETHPTRFLAVGRWAMGILSLLTAACVYTITRVLGGRRPAWLALYLYAIWPFAFFFERLAFADPIASVCAALLVWRCVALARHPRWWQGAGIGILLAGATLAKLSMAPLALVPPAATLLLPAWHSINHWLKTYLPALVVAALTVIAIWAPLTLPLYLTDPDYTITHPESYTRPDPNDPQNAQEYLERVWPAIEDFGPKYFYQAVVVAGLILLLVGKRRHAALIILWALGMTALIVGFATLTVARYFMPMAAPMVILIALAIGCISQWQRWRWIALPAALSALIYWSVSFALPFHRTATTDINALDFHATNWIQYQSGQLSGDEAVRAAAATINAERQADQPVYATWTICHLLFFYVEDGLTCIPDGHVMRDLTTYTQRDLADGRMGYVVIMAYPPFVEWLDHLRTEKIITHTRPNGYRPITIWRVWLR